MIFIDLSVAYNTARIVKVMTATITITLLITSMRGQRLPFSRNISKEGIKEKSKREIIEQKTERS